jgi:hypothetical protein
LEARSTGVFGDVRAESAAFCLKRELLWRLPLPVDIGRPPVHNISRASPVGVLLLLSALARSENAARRKGVVTSVGMSPLQVAR